MKKAGLVWFFFGSLIFGEEPVWPFEIGVMRQPITPIRDAKNGWFVEDPLTAKANQRRTRVPFPMPLNAARLRADTKDPSKWWIEIEIEHQNLGIIEWGHLGDWFSIANKGRHWSHFSISGYGYISKDEDTIRYLLAVFDGLETGRQFLGSLRQFHSNLPKDAIVDETSGEKHGPIHRFRASHMERTKKDWAYLTSALELKKLERPVKNPSYLPWVEESDNWFDFFRNFTTLAIANDPTQIGVGIYVPKMFEDQMEEAFPIANPDGFQFAEESYRNAIQRLTPKGWVVFPLTPRTAAIIPADAVYQDLDD